MTQAGWYPDPAGQPQTYRYWDGASWSQATTTNPYAAPPTPPPSAPPTPAPPAPSYGGYPAAPGYPATPSAPGGPGRSAGPGKTIALVVLAVVLIIGLGVGAFFGVMVLRGDDDTEAGEDPTTGATTSDTEETESSDATSDPSEWADPTTLQCTGGVPAPSVAPPNGATRVNGGGLSIPVPEGYVAQVDYAAGFTFADAFTPLQKVVIRDQWVSIYGVGGLRKANGFESPEQAAEVVMTCMSQSPQLYSGFSGRTDLSSEPVEIDGHDAHHVVSDIEVDDPEIDVAGDRAHVLVVDTGDGETYGLYVSVVPLGDDRLIAEQDALVEQIRVE